MKNDNDNSKENSMNMTLKDHNLALGYRNLVKGCTPLCGWLYKQREKGKIKFVDLRNPFSDDSSIDRLSNAYCKQWCKLWKGMFTWTASKSGSDICRGIHLTSVTSITAHPTLKHAFILFLRETYLTFIAKSLQDCDRWLQILNLQLNILRQKKFIRQLEVHDKLLKSREYSVRKELQSAHPSKEYQDKVTSKTKRRIETRSPRADDVINSFTRSTASSLSSERWTTLYFNQAFTKAVPLLQQQKQKVLIEKLNYERKLRLFQKKNNGKQRYKKQNTDIHIETVPRDDMSQSTNISTPFQALSLNDIETSLENIYQKFATVEDKKKYYKFLLSPLPNAPPPPTFVEDQYGNIIKIENQRRKILEKKNEN